MLSMASAAIQLVTPVHMVIDDLDEVSINPVGPGHEVMLKFQRRVSPCPTGYCGVWDSVRLANIVDQTFKQSTWSDHMYIYYSIDVLPEMPSGEYTFMFEILDKEALMDSEIAVVKVFVTHDQSDLVELVPYKSSSEHFAGNMNHMTFQIRNKALSKAKYVVSSEIPGYPSYSDTLSVDVEPSETVDVDVPFYTDQEGFYLLKSRVWSEDNPTISLRTSTEVRLRPTLRSKLRSIGSGIPLVPITMAPFYALLGLLGF